MANESMFNPNYGGDPIAPFLMSPLEQEILRKKKLSEEIAAQGDLQNWQAMNPGPLPLDLNPAPSYNTVQQNAPAESLMSRQVIGGFEAQKMNEDIAQAQKDAEFQARRDEEILNQAKEAEGRALFEEYKQSKYYKPNIYSPGLPFVEIGRAHV